MNSSRDPEKYSIRAVDRALAILLALTGDRSEMTVEELATTVDLHKSTAYRLIATLEAAGFLSLDPQRRSYRLGSAALLLGATAIGRLDLRTKARPHLEKLTKDTGETVHLAVLNSDTALCIDKIDGFRAVRMASFVGFRDPLHCTGVGKTLLAFQPEPAQSMLLSRLTLQRHTANTITDANVMRQQLQQIREQGYGLDNEEIEPGLRCIAAPVFDHSGQIVASISISGPVTRLMDAELPAAIEIVKAAASQISQDMGASPGR
jgi:DNA-binding IclR family transcriptional regulator